jgi:excisionase family DNA binding protein
MDTDRKLLVAGEPMEPGVILYSRRDAARLLSISLRTLDGLIASKVLLTRQIGRRRLIPRSTLEAFARRNHPTQPDGAKGGAR